MLKISAKKIICLTLFWLIAFQSAVFAVQQNPLELSDNIHCQEQNTPSHHDCCLDDLANNHCNSCLQSTLALTATEQLPHIKKTHFSASAKSDSFHPEPLLELFKPPI